MGPPVRRVALALVVVAGLAVAAGVVQLLRPVPTLSVQARLPATLAVPRAAPALPRPGSGEVGADVPGIGTLASPGSDHPVPMASLAKVMTAYVVFHDHPLAVRADGSGITLTGDNVAAYQAGVAQRESVKVVAGEALSERQALEVLLVASANNLAGALARWDSGSPAALVAEMNAAASRLGLSHTDYADPAGLDRPR